MALDSSLPTSRRGYLSQDELKQYANITISDSDEADDVISQAEEIIDAWVGVQDKFFKTMLEGKAVTAGATTLTLQTSQQNAYQQDYFVGMEIEIIGGTAKGERARITASTYAGVLTFTTITAPDNTSIYRIYQLGKFPRVKDHFFDSESGDNRYYKQIPEAVKRAVAAQVQFIIEMGDKFFASDEPNKESERIGDYSYTNAEGTLGVNKLIAPKAKLMLRGITNRKGVIIV